MSAASAFKTNCTQTIMFCLWTSHPFYKTNYKRGNNISSAGAFSNILKSHKRGSHISAACVFRNQNRIKLFMEKHSSYKIIREVTTNPPQALLIQIYTIMMFMNKSFL